MPCPSDETRRLTWCKHSELVSYPVGVGWSPLLSCNGSSGDNNDDNSRGSDDNNDDDSHRNKVHNSSARSQYHSSVHSEGDRCNVET